MAAGVTFGILLSAVGFGGKFLIKQTPKVINKINEILKSLYLSNPTIKYYKGGFEPSMTKREALLILGISGSESQVKVKEAHKRIMLLNHPDRGGSSYLAAKINETKEHIESCKP